MNIYVEFLNGKPVSAHWTLEDALRLTGLTEEQARERIVSVPMDPISIPTRRYFDFRGLKFPTCQQAFLFLTSELGELADELVQLAGGWVRNNPQEKGKGIRGEVGDVLMMLVVFSMQFFHEYDEWVDPIDAMFEKWASKGFPINASRREGGNLKKEEV